MSDTKDFRAMTAETIGKDLLSALIDELRLLPKPWIQLPQDKQNDVIDRLRKRVETNVGMAVHIITGANRTTVLGKLDQITSKNGIKAVFTIDKNTAGRYELLDAEGQDCLIVLDGAESYTCGMESVTGEPDQRAMDLGREYHEDDGGSMDEFNGADVTDGEVIEGEVLALPETVPPTDEQLDSAYTDGFNAAEQGQPESACPVMRGELCIEWVKGWKGFYEQAAEDNQPEGENQ